MNFFHFVLILPVSFLLYSMYRMVIGKPLQKRVLNIIFAVFLMLFFFITAGLGTFWVANQELPVFDLHYLFGYATVILVLVHLVFNWAPLSSFFRKYSPQTLQHKGKKTWRPAVQIAAWTIGLTLYGGVAFWLGIRQGGSQLEIKIADPVMSSLARGSGVVEENTALSPIIQHQLVTDNNIERTLADYYHEKTKHSRISVMKKSGGLNWSSRPRVFKKYPKSEVIDLPESLKIAGTSVGDAIDLGRREVKGFKSETMSLIDLSTILFNTNGVTGMLKYPGLTYYLRAAPSAGALYPTVTYILVHNVDGLAPGLYHYSVKEHKLHRLRSGKSLNEELSVLVDHGDLVQQAAVTFIFSAIFFRSSWKYGERSYRYCLLDAGHLAVQTTTTANALGYAGRLIGRFDDGEVNTFMGFEEQKEGTLVMVAVGKPSEKFSPAHDRPAFVSRPIQLTGDGNPLLALIHGRTYLQLVGNSILSKVSHGFSDKPYPGLPIIRLPKNFEKGDDLLPTIGRRRSARKWSHRGMTINQLSSVLYYAFGIRKQQGQALPDLSIEDNHALNLYIIINNVQGLDPGIYYYQRHEHALSMIQKKDYRKASYEIALFQKVVGYSDVAVIMTIDQKRLSYPDADRGYRYATLDAGMLGGRLYLQAVGLNLGCTGIGAFFDDEVSDVIKVDPKKELIIYMAAIGAKAPGSRR